MAKKGNDIKTTKLVRFLKILSSLEMKRFKKFLESPFHNSNELLVDLLMLLKKHHPTYDAPSLTKSNLYEKLFGPKRYNQQRLNDLMYDLRLLVEDFMIVSNVLNEKKNRQSALVNVLAKRNHASFSEESEKLVKIILAKGTYLISSDFLQLHQIYDQLWFHSDTYKNQNEAKAFKAAHENLDLFYVHTKLFYFGEQEGRKRVFNETGPTNFKAAILKFVEQEKSVYPLLLLFERIIELAKGEVTEVDYFLIKDEVIKYGPKLEKDLRRDLLLHLANYCVQKNNRGKAEFLKEALNIYKIIVDNDLLLINGRVNDVLFLNISNFANRLGEYEWASDFRKKYQAYLDANNAIETLNIAEIYTLFYQENFKAANELILQANLRSNSMYYAGIKVYLMKGLYIDWVKSDVNNVETLLDLAIAFEQSIKRNKDFSKEKIKAYLNFVKYFKRIIKLRKVGTLSKEKVQQLEEKIKVESLLTYKNWLLESIEELLK